MRQRKTLNTEISAPQRETLERILAEIPRTPAEKPVNLGSKLAQLFYHPNGVCRVMALVLSAGVDVVNGREANADSKLLRALEVLNLVCSDDLGRGHVETLRTVLSEENAGTSFLNELHDNVGPYFGQQLYSSDVKENSPREEQSTAPVMPENKDLTVDNNRNQSTAVQDNTDIGIDIDDSINLQEATLMAEEAAAAIEDSQGAEEHGSADIDTDDTDEDFAPDSTDTVAPDSTETVIEENDAEVVPADDSAPENTSDSSSEASDDQESFGISADEAQAAALAAQAAMDAPYEDVVQAHSRRFDPERDLDPDAPTQHNRRRSRAPVGLERPKPDQIARENAGNAGNAGKTSDTSSSPATAPESDEPFIFVTRGCETSDLAEALLEAAKRVIRQAKEVDIDYRIRIDIGVKRDTENRDNRGGRRHRGRRRGRGRRPRSND